MIAVLGAGIAGSALAYELAVFGAEGVHVFDPNDLGHGATTRATGGFRTQFLSRLNVELSLASRPFFVDHAGEIDFAANGYAFIASSPEERDDLAERRRIQARFSLPVEARPARELFPDFGYTSDAECNFCSLDGTFDPSKLLRLYREMAMRQGVRFHCGVEYVDPPATKLTVIACGTWSPEVARQYGLEVSLVGEKRQAWLLANVPVAGNEPLGVEIGSGWVFRSRKDGFLAVSPPLKDKPTAMLEDWLRSRFKKTPGARVVRSWSGFYELTPDHHPYVGRSTDPAVWLTCGFSGHGVMHAPAVARSLAALILGRTPSVNISALDPSRTEALVDASLV